MALLPALTLLTLLTLAANTILVVAVFRFIRRPRPRHVGHAPMRLVHEHRPVADWAAAEQTLILPVVPPSPTLPVVPPSPTPPQAPEARPARRRRSRRPKSTVPGVDAEVIEIGRRLSKRLRGGDDAS